MAKDLAHTKHPVQCLATARKRVTSEQESPIHLREPCMHGMQLKPVHTIIADSAKRSCPTTPDKNLLGNSHSSHFGAQCKSIEAAHQSGRHFHGKGISANVLLQLAWLWSLYVLLLW